MHHFCYPCLFQWCVKNNSCPTCRQPIFEIKFDVEFDILLHGKESSIFRHPNQIKIAFPKGKKAGVTLRNNEGPGVQITSLTEKDQFYLAGLRKGNVILFVNNIPCNNHNFAINIINNASYSNMPLLINTLMTI